MLPLMDARFALPAVNIFLADVGGGLGPFLSTWLEQARGWNTDQIGTVIAVGTLVGGLLAGPAGWVLDHLGRPRLLLGLGCAMILGGTLLLLSFHAFALVMAAQVVVAAGGALGGPSSSGLTLSVVGKDGFPRQHGTNQAANHMGNVVAALGIAGLTFIVGPIAAVYVLFAMALATIAVLCLMNGNQIDFDRMRGRKRGEHGSGSGATRGLARTPHLWKLMLVIGLFQLGSSAMLPLLGQRVVAEGHGTGTVWMSACVIVAQVVMVPVAFLVGRYADQLGRRMLLMGACAVVIARCALATFATGNWFLLPIEVLDGIAAGVFSVAAPLAVADLTYGSGRTQTSIGGMAMVQSGGAALASFTAGWAVHFVGYWPTFAAMAVFPALAIAVLMTLTLRNDAAKQPDDRSQPAPAPA